MAILQEGTVLAGIRGKIGNIVIYQWKNKVCARSKPKKKDVKKQSELLRNKLNPIK
ncbi:hypothetical protein [Pedobacter sp. NJ-S-72]